MTLDALKHRDVAEIYRMLEWFVRLVTALTLARLQSAEVDRMFETAAMRILFGWAR